MAAVYEGSLKRSRGREPLRLSPLLYLEIEVPFKCVDNIRVVMWLRTPMRRCEIRRDVHLKNARHRYSLVQLPRPFEWSPVPEGRKSGRWR